MTSSRTSRWRSKARVASSAPEAGSRSSPFTRSRIGSSNSSSRANRATAFVLPTSPPASAGTARACVSLPGGRYVRPRRRSAATRAPAARPFASPSASLDVRAGRARAACAARAAPSPAAGRPPPCRGSPDGRSKRELGGPLVPPRERRDRRGVSPRPPLSRPSHGGFGARLRSPASFDAAARNAAHDRAPGGAILATTVELRSLYAIPGRIVGRGATAAALAPILGEHPDVLRAALESGGEWLYLRRRLPEDTANRIEALRIEGLGFEKEPKRLYPSGAIGAQVLGFVNDDGLGQYGVEGRYDDVLRGVPGRLVVERDPASRQLALGLRTGLNAKDGQDLVLTLDLAIQTAVERELAAAVQSEKATSGSVVVLDPRDGAVRALASSPSYDPARVAAATNEALRDRAISWTYEPGSTMKAITIAAALDKGVVTPKTSYNDVGYAVIGGRGLSNAYREGHGLTEVAQG